MLKNEINELQKRPISNRNEEVLAKELKDLKIENKMLNEGLIESKKAQINLQQKVKKQQLFLVVLNFVFFFKSNLLFLRFLIYNDTKSL